MLWILWILSNTCPSPTSATLINFSGNDTRLCENDILKGVFGVDYNEYVFGNE